VGIKLPVDQWQPINQ